MLATNWILICWIAAFAVSLVITKLEIPVLIRVKAGQNIREDGPQAHLSKAGTPSMGGFSIIIASVVVALIVLRSPDMYVICASIIAFGFVGFCDDYLKIVKHNNLGLRAWQKMAMLFVFSIALAVYGYNRGALVTIPFIKEQVSFGLLYIPFAIFVILAMTNAVNLTDGIDGLSSSVTCLVALTVGLISGGSSAIFGCCLSGACIGYFMFNKYPAKLFMGDTGSLALGGALAAMAICSDSMFSLPIAGGIYVAETLSVIIQVFVFKTQNGRRFFRMAPLHHHFEMGGWKETKIVGVFFLVTAALCLLALLVC